MVARCTQRRFVNLRPNCEVFLVGLLVVSLLTVPVLKTAAHAFSERAGRTPYLYGCNVLDVQALVANIMTGKRNAPDINGDDRVDLLDLQLSLSHVLDHEQEPPPPDQRDDQSLCYYWARRVSFDQIGQVAATAFFCDLPRDECVPPPQRPITVQIPGRVTSRFMFKLTPHAPPSRDTGFEVHRKSWKKTDAARVNCGFLPV